MGVKMAAIIWSACLKKSPRFFNMFKGVEFVQFFKKNSPAILRLGQLMRWNHFHQCSAVHHRLYSSTQKCSSLLQDHPCLHSSFGQASPQPLSTLTSQESPESTTNEEKTEELDTLYKTVELKVKGHDDAVLDSYAMFVSMAAKELGVTVQEISKPLRKIKRLTVLKSRHIYKKHRVQYEMRTYFRIIKLIHLTGSTADVFLEYVERNLPEGVALKVTKCALEKLPDHLQSPPEGSVESSSSSSTSSSTSGDEDENPREIKD